MNSEENATIWTLPYGLIGAQKVEDIQYYKRDDLKLVQEAVTSSGKWYQFAIDEKVIGWIKADFIKIQ
nr:GW domain-containing glycosaminoglycan-binding protein [Listeria fleischmannii]